MEKNKLFIKQNERQLLLYSQITNDYPWLLTILKKNERITYELVELLPKDKKEFLHTQYRKLLKIASEEWERDTSIEVEDLGENEEDWTKCTLDNRPNRFVFYIKNIRNGTSINVGSECIKKFDFFSEKDRIKLEKEARRMRRLVKLNREIPDIERIINDWEFELEKMPIVIPNNLREPYQDKGHKAKELFEKIPDGKSTDITELKKYLQIGEEYLLNIRNYVSANKDKRFIANKEIEIWLKRKDTTESREALKNILETGMITIFSIHRIREKNFMESLIPDINSVVPDLEIIKADFEREGYIYRLKQQENISLFCKHKIILEEYGGKILGIDTEYNPNIDRVIDFSDVNDEKSYYVIISWIERLVDHIRIKTNYEFNQVIIEIAKGKKKYIIINLDKLANEFKSIGLLSKEKATEAFDKLVADTREYSKLELAERHQPAWISWDRILPSDEEKLKNLKESDFDIFYE